jgi:hypothetical protein
VWRKKDEEDQDVVEKGRRLWRRRRRKRTWRRMWRRSM